MCKCSVDWPWLRALCLVWLCLVPAAWAAGAPAQRAIWMWEEDSWAMLKSPAQARDKIAFLKRQGVGTLYLYADAHDGRHLLLQQPQRYAQLIGQLHRQGLSILLVEQNVGQSLEIAQRAYVMENGQIRFDGLPQDLLASDELRQAYLGL